MFFNIDNNTGITSNMKTWYLPYGEPDKNTSILNDNVLEKSLNPLFKNVYHPYNPQYNQSNIAELNHNMLEGQPEYQKQNLTKAYTGQKNQTMDNKLGLLSESQIKDADIKWDSFLLSPTQQSQQDDLSYSHYKIDPDFRALPDGKRNFQNPHVMNGTLTQIVPWDSINNDNEDEYFNERNFQKIYNHPFYGQMKPMLEQPFKHL